MNANKWGLRLNAGASVISEQVQTDPCTTPREQQQVTAPNISFKADAKPEPVQSPRF